MDVELWVVGSGVDVEIDDEDVVEDVVGWALDWVVV